jgi:hypothetical protein
VKRISSTTITRMRVTRGNMRHRDTRSMCEDKCEMQIGRQNVIFGLVVLTVFQKHLYNLSQCVVTH